jgi:[acyl-carrier-protein] S-malonyltransferase
MGRQLSDTYPEAARVFEEADAALGFPLSTLCFEGPEDQLRLPENTQPAILTASVAALRVLESKGIRASFAAGHSLGEYSAHVAAGTLSFADAVRTVRNRGRYMQEAVPPGEGAMAAILGMPSDNVADICAMAAHETNAVVSPANLNSPDQIVISGAKAAVERAAELAKARGAKRAVMLPVSAPFHCILMQPAQDRLANDLDALTWNAPQFPVVANIDGELVTGGSAAREALINQVTGSVRWINSMRTLIAQGVTHYIEVGPGKVLCGLMRQIDRSQTCLNVEDNASLEKTLAALK